MHYVQVRHEVRHDKRLGYDVGSHVIFVSERADEDETPTDHDRTKKYNTHKAPLQQSQSCLVRSGTAVATNHEEQSMFILSAAATVAATATVARLE
jgi:hypothetical protein